MGENFGLGKIDIYIIQCSNSHQKFYSSYFNEDISGWDVSNVINTVEMFRQAVDFNQNDKWFVCF